jgi:hypothetical protein
VASERSAGRFNDSLRQACGCVAGALLRRKRRQSQERLGDGEELELVSRLARLPGQHDAFPRLAAVMILVHPLLPSHFRNGGCIDGFPRIREFA